MRITDFNKKDKLVPLCVDLDGTLLHTDLLFESLLALIKKNILFIFMLPLWLYRGKSFLKNEIAFYSDLDVKLFPYNQELIDYLLEQKRRGRYIILVTASNKKYAEKVADYIGIFDEVMSSDVDVNLSGVKKRSVLVDAFGYKGFDYAGNSKVDFEIWPHSRQAIIVSPDVGVLSKAKRLLDNPHIFIRETHGVRVVVKQLRIHQWAKNVLIFVPLVMAHKFTDYDLVFETSLAFLSFCLCASAGYVINDMLDMESDRKHKTKCTRPLAAGMLGIKNALLITSALLAASLSIGLLLPLEFIVSIVLYFFVTCFYSIWLKHSAYIDVLVLAGLYSVRLIAGAAAISVDLSFWLLAFSMFLFFSLALVKRFSELMSHKVAKKKGVKCRAYYSMDLFMLAQTGVASGLLAVLVLAMYIDSDAITLLYAQPELMWLICPLLMYWISRVWLLANRGEMNEDPVLFALKDGSSHRIALMMVVILWMAA